MSEYTPEGKRGPVKAATPVPTQSDASTSAQHERGRPDRKEEVQTRRRRRTGLGDDRNLKLHIPESLKDANFEYRWVNDRAGRVRQMTVEDDWDVVDTVKLGVDPDPEQNIAEGTVMARIGDKITGERMTLLRKPKEFYDSDRKERFERLDKLEASMKRAAPPSQQGLSAQDNAYVPGGKNTIGR
jgi:hypothetical protein